MEDRHLSLATVAGRLGVSERTVRRWIKAGKLKAYRPGRDYRIPESAFRAFVEESEFDPKAEAPPEPTLLNGLEDERRTASLRSWIDFVGRLANRWEKEITERENEPQPEGALAQRTRLNRNLHWAVEIMETHADVVEAFTTDPNYDALLYDSEEVRELYVASRRLTAIVDRTKAWFPSSQDSPHLAEVIDLRQDALERMEKKLGSRAS
jgi:excisionase family DNA binding protein